MPERIYIAIRFQLVHFSSFYGKESDGICILFGPCDIDLTMADIEITAGDNFFSFIPEFIDIVDEVVIEFQFIAQHLCSVSSFTAVREIDIQ